VRYVQLIALLKFNKHHEPAGTEIGGQFASVEAWRLQPGIYQKNGVWVRNGKTVTGADAATLKRMRVPPAWKDVKVNPNPDAKLQVIGKDVKGRTQYLYSAAHSEQAAAEKFARIKAFHDALPNLRNHMTRDIHDPNQPAAVRESALVLRLIDKTTFRVGSNAETHGVKKAYGATTLRGEHVTILGNKVAFSFVGKKGVQIDQTITDPVLAKELRARKREAKNGPLFKVTDSRLRQYIKDEGFGGFSPKDFRTYHATSMALALVRKTPMPGNRTQAKKARKEVATKVSTKLGNSPAMALASYISPEVFSDWEDLLYD